MSTVLTRDEIEEIVIDNAKKHPEYKSALLSNPKKVIETQLNNKLPENLNVKAVEESADTIYIRLPYVVKAGDELSDADLEQVAGGKGIASDDTQSTSYTCNDAKGGFNTRNEFNASVSLL